MMRNLAWVIFALLAQPWLRPKRRSHVVVIDVQVDGREVARAVQRRARK
jgi:hypothetical protein